MWGGEGTLEEHRKFKNKFAATQQQTKAEKQMGSEGQHSETFSKKTSIQFVSLSLSFSLSLSACLSLALTLSCRWSSVNVRLNVTLRMRHVVRCTSTWHNWQRLAHSSVPPSVPLSRCLSVCAPCSLAVWATFARMSSAVCLVQFSLCGRYTKNNRRIPSPTI